MFFGFVYQFFSIRWVKEGRGKNLDVIDMQLVNNIVVKELIVYLAQNQASCSMLGNMHYSYNYGPFPFEFNDDIKAVHSFPLLDLP